VHGLGVSSPAALGHCYEMLGPHAEYSQNTSISVNQGYFVTGTFPGYQVLSDDLGTSRLARLPHVPEIASENIRSRPSLLRFMRFTTKTLCVGNIDVSLLPKRLHSKTLCEFVL
jgi:hypothetical protein